MVLTSANLQPPQHYSLAFKVDPAPHGVHHGLGLLEYLLLHEGGEVVIVMTTFMICWSSILRVVISLLLAVPVLLLVSTCFLHKQSLQCIINMNENEMTCHY